jgi:acetolactate synthase small subunit
MTTFLVDAENMRDILARVVMLFHRKAIPIHSFIMVSGRDGALRIKFIAGTDESRSLRIVADLYKLVGVRLVKVSASEHPREAIQLAIDDN